MSIEPCIVYSTLILDGLGWLRGGSYEMSAGRGEWWGECLFNLAYSLFSRVYSTLIFIDVCMGEGRTASLKKLMK